MVWVFFMGESQSPDEDSVVTGVHSTQVISAGTLPDRCQRLASNTIMEVRILS